MFSRVGLSLDLSSTVSSLFPTFPIPSSPFFWHPLEEVDMWGYAVLYFRILSKDSYLVPTGTFSEGTYWHHLCNFSQVSCHIRNSKSVSLTTAAEATWRRGPGTAAPSITAGTCTLSAAACSFSMAVRITLSDLVRSLARRALTSYPCLSSFSWQSAALNTCARLHHLRCIPCCCWHSHHLLVLKWQWRWRRHRWR